MTASATTGTTVPTRWPATIPMLAMQTVCTRTCAAFVAAPAFPLEIATATATNSTLWETAVGAAQPMLTWTAFATMSTLAWAPSMPVASATAPARFMTVVVPRSPRATAIAMATRRTRSGCAAAPARLIQMVTASATTVTTARTRWPATTTTLPMARVPQWTSAACAVEAASRLAIVIAQATPTTLLACAADPAPPMPTWTACATMSTPVWVRWTPVVSATAPVPPIPADAPTFPPAIAIATATSSTP